MSQERVFLWNPHYGCLKAWDKVDSGGGGAIGAKEILVDKGVTSWTPEEAEIIIRQLAHRGVKYTTHTGMDTEPSPADSAYERKVYSGTVGIANLSDLQRRPIETPQERPLSREEADALVRQRHGQPLAPGIPPAPPAPPVPTTVEPPPVARGEGYHCSLCPLSFPSPAELRGHLDEAHSAGPRKNAPPPQQDAFDDHNFIDPWEAGDPAPPDVGKKKASKPSLPNARKRAKARERRLKAGGSRNDA